jgi:hypothetical protein
MVICPACAAGVDASSDGDFAITREDDDRVVMKMAGVVIHRCADGSYPMSGEADPELQRLLAEEELPPNADGDGGVREPRRPSGSGPSLGATADG